MNLVIGAMPFFLVAFILSLFLTPLAKRIGFYLKIYALENNRTVHHGRMVRMGGLAIFLSFMITMAIFVRADSTLNAILIGALIIFIGGLIDDIFDLKPIVKLAFQIAAAVYVIVFGNLSLDFINIEFMSIDIKPISFLVSIIWIVGVANAINLIDGLDGLSSGISFIVLSVIGLIGFFMGRRDICIIALIMIGGIAGFLPYNFHPASIFVGDCGALFMGYMIACLSLLGFKTSTFITLGFPIIILFVPLSDTCLAIIRRKLKGQKISEADRSHLHHVLMYKIGLSHRNTVLLLYFVTFLFGTCAVVTYFNEFAGIIFLFILCCCAWMFIELTGMINPKFHPIIGLMRRTIGYPAKSEDAFFEANKIRHEGDSAK